MYSRSSAGTVFNCVSMILFVDQDFFLILHLKYVGVEEAGN